MSDSYVEIIHNPIDLVDVVEPGRDPVLDIDSLDTTVGALVAEDAAATHAAVDARVVAGTALVARTGQYQDLAGKPTIPSTKNDIGLGNVDNTSDLNKPLSTAAVTALASKADLVGGVLPSSQIPALALVTAVPVASQAAMLALTAAQVQPGDVAIRSDGAGTFMLVGTNPASLSSWKLLNSPTDAVTSVNGQLGTVVLGASDVGAITPAAVDTKIAAQATAAASTYVPLAGGTLTGDLTSQDGSRLTSMNDLLVYAVALGA